MPPITLGRGRTYAAEGRLGSLGFRRWGPLGIYRDYIGHLGGLIFWIVWGIVGSLLGSSLGFEFNLLRVQTHRQTDGNTSSYADTKGKREHARNQLGALEA